MWLNYGSNSTTEPKITYNTAFYGKICSRCQLELPGTHFSDHSSRIRLDSFAVKRLWCMHAQTHTGLALLMGFQRWGGVNSFWETGWGGRERGLLSEMPPFFLTESGGGRWKRGNFRAMELRSGSDGRLQESRGHWLPWLWWQRPVRAVWAAMVAGERLWQPHQPGFHLKPVDVFGEVMVF